MTINFVTTVNCKNRQIYDSHEDKQYMLSVMKSYKNKGTRPNTKGKQINIFLIEEKYYKHWRRECLFNDTDIFIIRDLSATEEISNKDIKKCRLNPRIKSIYFIDWFQFDKYYEKYNLNIFAYGSQNTFSRLSKKYEILNFYVSVKDNGVTFCRDFDCFEYIDNNYSIVYISEYDNNTRRIRYTLTQNKKHRNEENYIKIINDLLSARQEKLERPDRTGIGTISLFGVQTRFNIKDTIPLLTTKKIAFWHIVEELLWICRGDTDAKILSNKGVKIWNQNTSRKFLDSRNLNYKEGILGPGYGWQMRHFGHKYSEEYADTSEKCLKNKGFDQLETIVELIKKDPFSRRIYASYWNPVDLEKMALVPCHTSIQFYVDVIKGVKHLSCHFTMRSTDVFLGLPYNICFYALLTHIIALKTDMVPHELVYTGGDVHLYKNHYNAAKEQLKRDPRPEPCLFINPDVKYKDWSEISRYDFEIVGYFPSPVIKADMAV